MIALGCLWFLFAALLVPSASNQVVALSAEENLDFIDEVLVLLNNRNECILPTFEEVDDLNLSFNELEELWGADFESNLSEDQKVLKNTLLDQWDSFQKRTKFGVVIRSAKKRSFLCKVESYQKAKFGSSVCTDTNVISNPKSDSTYERNSIVRYVKHLESLEVSEKEDQKIEIHLTPISRRDSAGSDFSPRGGIIRGNGNGARGGGSQSAGEEYNQNESYDPLADIPDVHSSDSESEDDTASTYGSNPFARIESSVAGNAFVPREEYETEIDDDHSTVELEDDLSRVGLADESDESSAIAVAASSSDAFAHGTIGSYKDSIGVLEVEDVDATGTIAAAPSTAETAGVADGSKDAGDAGEAEGASDNADTDGPANRENKSGSFVAVDDDVTLAEAVSGANDDIAAAAAATYSRRKTKELLKSRDAVYVDDETDDKYLRRLTKIKPMLFEFGITYKGFKWPDESSKEEFNFDDTVKIDWNRFVNDPDSCVNDALILGTPVPTNSRIRGGGSFWAAGPKSEERNSISDWDQTPTGSNVKESSLKQSVSEPIRLESKISSKLSKFVCKSFGRLFSSKKRSKDKKRLMKAHSDL